jgi:hypothetical protein
MEYDVRGTLKSSGEHVYAVRRLPEKYSVDDYLAAITRAREVCAGEAYADAVLGKSDEESETVGQELLDRAMADLKSRGVHDPSYQELARALEEVSS